jgi:hypothetical protein
MCGAQRSVPVSPRAVPWLVAVGGIVRTCACGIKSPPDRPRSDRRPHSRSPRLTSHAAVLTAPPSRPRRLPGLSRRPVQATVPPLSSGKCAAAVRHPSPRGCFTNDLLTQPRTRAHSTSSSMPSTPDTSMTPLQWLPRPPTRAGRHLPL